jgi:hypothetical protein
MYSNIEGLDGMCVFDVRALIDSDIATLTLSDSLTPMLPLPRGALSTSDDSTSTVSILSINNACTARTKC